MSADQAQALRGLVEAHERRQRQASRPNDADDREALARAGAQHGEARLALARDRDRDRDHEPERQSGVRDANEQADPARMPAADGQNSIHGYADSASLGADKLADNPVARTGHQTTVKVEPNARSTESANASHPFYPDGQFNSAFANGDAAAFASANEMPRLARAVAVTSGKGGVGKTTVAVNLAVQLARLNQRVVLLDADLGTANVDVMCNRMPSNRLARVIEGRATLEEVIVDAPGGFRLIPGGSGLAQVANLNDDQRRRLIRQMKSLEAESDIMLIDTSAGVGENVLGFTLAADQVLVVTSPEPTAITDAYAVIKMICRQSARPEVRLVVNMVRDEEEARGVFKRMTAVCERFLNFTPSFGGYVSNDPRIVTGIRQRRPFTLEHPKSPASANLGRLAQSLTPAMEPEAQARKRRSLLGRIAGLFGR